MAEYTVTEDGSVVRVPDSEFPKATNKDDMSDLFEVPKSTDNDIVIDHLFELPADDDLSDLVEIKQSDLTGYPDEKAEPPSMESQEQEDNEPHWSDADIARAEQERALPEAHRRRPIVVKRTTRQPNTPSQLGEMR